MECSEPGAIRDEELAAYLVGDKVRPEVMQHLAHCQACSSQVAAFQRMDLQLTNKLYRWDCPPSQKLGEYQLGMLGQVDTNEIRSHLLFCLRCNAEVATLAEFLTNDPLLAAPVPVAMKRRQPVQEALRALDQWKGQTVEGARRIVASLVAPQPRLAFQREMATPVSWLRNYVAEDLTISVQVEQSRTRRDSLQIIGFVKRNGTALESLEGTPVNLLSQTKLVETQQIDDLGNFLFATVSPALYSLELQFPESVVVIDALLIEAQE